MHAEEVALAKMPREHGKGKSLLVARITTSPDCSKQSYPCSKCREKIDSYGIRKVYFTS